MRQIEKCWHSLHPSDQLLLTVRAAQLAKDDGVFGRLVRVLDTVVKQAKPRNSVDEISARLTAVAGTALEPFKLSNRNLALACRLAQLAFSERYSQECFRVISEMSLGIRGGVLLSADGKDRFIERFMLRDNDFYYGNCWYWAPALPLSDHMLAMALHTEVNAVARSSDLDGMRVEVALSAGKRGCSLDNESLTELEGFLAWSYRRFEAAVVCKGATTPVELAISFEDDDDQSETSQGVRLIISPTSPESIMRFSALMASSSTLQIGSEYGGPGKAQLRIKLALPEQGPTDLPVEFRRVDSLFSSFFLLEHDIPIPLSEEDLHALLNEHSLSTAPCFQEDKVA